MEKFLFVEKSIGMSDLVLRQKSRVVIMECLVGVINTVVVDIY